MYEDTIDGEGYEAPCIVSDVEILVSARRAAGRLRGAFRDAIERRERLAVPALVLYEWLRGPRPPEELHAQEALLPSSDALPFGPDEAALAAELYRSLPRGRGSSWCRSLPVSAPSQGLNQ
ncbi:MAG: hypothetical protein Q8N53_03955 [Longimicrobiales bacterium]|nr:hypothetical protein [Longimicrobiales bacterium]